MDNIAVNSGVSSVVMNLYRNINREIIQFDFLVSKRTEESYEEEIHRYGGNVFYTGNPLSPKTLIGTCIRNRQFFRENSRKYVAAHLHSPTITDMTIKYANKYGLKNIIIHSHSTMSSINPLKSFVNTFLQRNIFKYANLYFACSTEAAEFLYGKKFCKEHKIELIKNAVEPEKYLFDAECKKKIIDGWRWNGNTVVAHVSNFSPIKNVTFLIPVIDKTIKRRNDIRFLFIGDGPTRDCIETCLNHKNLQDYCKFLGSTDKVNHFLNAVDVLVLPSVKEGLPVSVVEAQANGIQCLVSDTVTREVNAGNVQFLRLEESEWTDRICECKPVSNSERAKKSAAFKESCFNINKEVKRLEGIYLKLK